MPGLYTAKQKYVAAVVCVCFVLVSLLSLSVITVHAGHECPGSRCEICLYAAHIKSGLDKLGLALITASAVLICVCLGTFFLNNKIKTSGDTPISLRVKLNK